MKKQKSLKEEKFLDELAQLKIHGGTKTSYDTNLTINLGRGCGTFGDCAKTCIPERPNR